MKHTYSKMCQRLPIRARVALVLAVAERVMPVLASHAEASKAAERALAAAWRWEQGTDQPALRLYDDHIEPLAVQGSLLDDSKASAALYSVTSAFFYVLWHAFKLDLIRKHVRPNRVPNDIADITEEVIDEVCDYAIQTSLCDDDWIGTNCKRLNARFDTGKPDQLGEPVVPRFFE